MAQVKNSFFRLSLQIFRKYFCIFFGNRKPWTFFFVKYLTFFSGEMSPSSPAKMQVSTYGILLRSILFYKKNLYKCDIIISLFHFQPRIALSFYDIFLFVESIDSPKIEQKATNLLKT